MSIYDKLSFNKTNTINSLMHKIMQPSGPVTERSSKAIALDNFYAINPGKEAPRKIFISCDGSTYDIETYSKDYLSTAYIDILPEYKEKFKEAVEAEEEREKENHILRALFKKLLNEANTYQELFFMMPKSMEPLLKHYFVYSVKDAETLQDHRYYAAIKKGVKFNRENKKSIDVLKNRLFINMLLQK